MERVLVAQTGFLGDVVLTTPLLTTLRQVLTLESLTVLTTPQAEQLIKNHPAVDHVMTAAKRQEDRGLKGLLRTTRRVREGRFTMAIAAHKSLRTALLLYMARIPHRIGFSGTPGQLLYHQAIGRDPQLHEIERILCLMRAFHIEPEACIRKPHVACSDNGMTRARILLQNAGIDSNEEFFVVCPGAVWRTKRWTKEGYSELVRSLSRRYGRVLLCGSEADRALANEIETRAGEPSVLNLAGKVDLETFVSIIDKATLVISNDSAPMHLAVARNVPVVAIFCATTPALGYGPYTNAAVVVEKKDLPCRPCSRHGGNRCPIKTEACMKSVTCSDVLAGVDRLIKRTA